MTKAKKKRHINRFTVINAALILVGTLGAMVMVGALVIAVSGLITHHGVPLEVPSPTPSASSTIDANNIENTRTYTFSSSNQLKDFTQKGVGKVTISPGHRMRIQTVPDGYKSVTLTVTVDGNSTVRFDDQVSSEENFDFSSFLIDGKTVNTASGRATGNAKYQVFPLEYGKHTLTWQYKKDYDVNKYADSYYVDNITITHVFTEAYLKS